MRLLQQIARHWKRFASNEKRNRFFSTQAARVAKSSKEEGLLTHVPAKERPSFSAIQPKLKAIQLGLQNHATLSATEKATLSVEAERLSEFELGRFLIANQGALSGWWTYYCILGFRKNPITHPVERFLLEEAPSILATRERFGHFQKVMQQTIDRHARATSMVKVASIPGGMAADMLTHAWSVDPKRCQLQFVNIDLDASVFHLSKKLAAETGCDIPLECRHEDAWSLTANKAFNLVLSNGLNIYVPEREKVIALYESLLKTLKPGGTLVTSALTPPPNHDLGCEWQLDRIDAAALARQAGIFAHILQATWSNFCTTEEMLTRLMEAGAINIQVIPDSRNMFPTFVAQKPS